MQYYNHHGQLVEYDSGKSNKQLSGCTATAYFFDDYVFKEYFDCVKAYRIKYKMFNLMNSIKDRHIARIDELLMYTDKYNSNMNSETNFSLNNADAYVMPVYYSDGSNILDKYMEYNFQMISELDQLIQLLTQMQILIADVKTDNAIIQENNIVLIDWDLFSICDNFSFETLLEYNRKRLNTFFFDLFSDSSPISRDTDIIINLENSVEIKQSLLSQEQIKGLKKYKTMREYLNYHQ